MWLAYQKSDILGSWWEDINIADAPQVNISIIVKVWITGGRSTMSSLESVCKQVCDSDFCVLSINLFQLTEESCSKSDASQMVCVFSSQSLLTYCSCCR